jgi:exosortase
MFGPSSPGEVWATKGPGRLLLPAIVGGILLWAYWPTVVELVRRWSNDSRYSHGFLVPVFAIVLLRMRQGAGGVAGSPAPWIGVALVALGCTLRVFAAAVYNDWLDAVSLLPVLGGLLAIWGGRPALRWAWPSIVFLIFMIPLPYRLQAACSAQLQPAASRASAYALRVLGFPALVDGNQVELLASGFRLKVGDECSGLSMLFSLLAVTTAVALILPRRLADRVVIIASAVPIAWLVNVSRITATGIFHEQLQGRLTDHTLHDLAGWCAIPLAMGLLWIEIGLLSRLLVDETATQPVFHVWGQSAGAMLPSSALAGEAAEGREDVRIHPQAS